MKQLSLVLSQLMAKRDIKSAELARKTGIGQPVIHRLMTGVTDNPQIQTLIPIAKFFGISVDQLMGVSPLCEGKLLDNATMHVINNKLATAKTIVSTLVDLLPALLESHKKAIHANLVEQSLSLDWLPHIALNASNLLNITYQLHDLLTNNEKEEVIR